MKGGIMGDLADTQYKLDTCTTELAGTKSKLADTIIQLYTCDLMAKSRKVHTGPDGRDVWDHWGAGDPGYWIEVVENS